MVSEVVDDEVVGVGVYMVVEVVVVEGVDVGVVVAAEAVVNVVVVAEL